MTGIARQIADLRHEARRHERQIATLKDRYGTGTRPSWVGEEIAMSEAAARTCRDTATAMEAAMAEDGEDGECAS